MRRRRAGEGALSEQVLDLRHEDLVASPRPQIRRLGAFLGLTVDELLSRGLRQPGLSDRQPVAGQSLLVRRPGSRHRAARAPPSAPGRLRL
ncbi:hypothetical protein ACRAWD_26845 [Caulobacter segnis]